MCSPAAAAVMNAVVEHADVKKQLVKNKKRKKMKDFQSLTLPRTWWDLQEKTTCQVNSQVMFLIFPTIRDKVI